MKTEETERNWKQEEKLEDQEILAALRKELERRMRQEILHGNNPGPDPEPFYGLSLSEALRS